MKHFIILLSVVLFSYVAYGDNECERSFASSDKSGIPAHTHSTFESKTQLVDIDSLVNSDRILISFFNRISQKSISDETLADILLMMRGVRAYIQKTQNSISIDYYIKQFDEINKVAANKDKMNNVDMVSYVKVILLYIEDLKLTLGLEENRGLTNYEFLIRRSTEVQLKLLDIAFSKLFPHNKSRIRLLLKAPALSKNLGMLLEGIPPYLMDLFIKENKTRRGSIYSSLLASLFKRINDI